MYKVLSFTCSFVNKSVSAQGCQTTRIPLLYYLLLGMCIPSSHMIVMVWAVLCVAHMYEKCDYTLLVFLYTFALLLYQYAVGTIYNVAFYIVGSRWGGWGVCGEDVEVTYLRNRSKEARFSEVKIDGRYFPNLWYVRFSHSYIWYFRCNNSWTYNVHHYKFVVWPL